MTHQSCRGLPVYLRLACSKGTTLATGDPLSVMGWGSTAEGASNAPSLLEAQVQVVGHDACNAAYDNQISDTQICAGVPAGGKDACQGDSGGPLVIKGSSAARDTLVRCAGSMRSCCSRVLIPGMWVLVCMLCEGIRAERAPTNMLVVVP